MRRNFDGLYSLSQYHGEAVGVLGLDFPRLIAKPTLSP